VIRLAGRIKRRYSTKDEEAPGFTAQPPSADRIAIMEELLENMKTERSK
jgi:hypothetical protein